jgi:hypothetical protein
MLRSPRLESTGKPTLPSLVGIYNPFQEELFCYQSFCIKPLWAELWYNKPFYCSVVGSAVVGRAFLLQTVVARIVVPRIVVQQNVVARVVVARIVVQQSVVGSAVVARAAVEPNWDLHISPARSSKQRPMSRRGTSFGTIFEGLVLVSLGPILVPPVMPSANQTRIL